VTSEGDLYFCPQPLASAETFVQTLTVTTSSTSLSFGTQLVGTTSSPQKRDHHQYRQGPGRRGQRRDYRRFLGADEWMPIRNPARESCTLGIVFVPTAIGSLSGTLTITDNATGSPQTVALSGTELRQRQPLSRLPEPFDLWTGCDVYGCCGARGLGTPTGTVQFAIDGSASVAGDVGFRFGHFWQHLDAAEGTHTVTCGVLRYHGLRNQPRAC